MARSTKSTWLAHSSAALLLAACVPAAADESRPCFDNFTSSGSFFSGKTFQTKFTVPGVAKKTAVERAAKELAMEGLTVVSQDKESGLVSATNPVIGGTGGQVPFVVSVEDNGNHGVDVVTKFSIGVAKIASADTTRENFCKIADAIAKK